MTDKVDPRTGRVHQVLMVRVKTDVGVDGAEEIQMLVRMVRVKTDVGIDGTDGTVKIDYGMDGSGEDRCSYGWYGEDRCWYRWYGWYG